MKKFGERLRSRAKELGMSNADVARAAGVSDQRYGNYVTDLREPDLDTLVRIASALRTTPDVLLGVADGKSTDPKRDRLVAAAEVVPSEALDIVTVQLEALGRPGKPKRPTAAK